MISQKLKIGLDYHGVIDKKLDYFAGFCKEARARGHIIFIITGGPEAKVKEYLTLGHIEYDFVFAILDYCQALGVVKQKPDGGFAVAEDVWNKAKADYCRKNKINLHIDDSLDYLHWFSTPFCLYDKKGDFCYMSPGIELDFSLPPAEVLDKIEKTAAKIGKMPFLESVR